MTTSWDAAAQHPPSPRDAAGASAAAEVTLGLAVPVPEPWAARLTAEREATGDPVARSVPPHVTLVPPVVVPADAVAAVLAHVRDRVRTRRSFTLRLRGTGTFRPVSQVSFVTVADGAAECDDLQEHVRCGPLTRRLGFPYHPHVTVGHDVPDDALDAAEDRLADFDVSFTVASVSLFRCGTDGVWRVLADAPLEGRPLA
ncbi:2'-5' RNA ligase family protein [Aquipuribacter nitratireducens]|uniref:2'-5' RNA ligase family protein n=1 Tax=Aquipuribacter nitratireducens TaxID=650104 RepID=A0ABW0GJZ0_9MICO